MAVHVRYKSMFISLLSFAKQERKMATFSVVCGTRTATTKGLLYPIFQGNKA